MQEITDLQDRIKKYDAAWDDAVGDEKREIGAMITSSRNNLDRLYTQLEREQQQQQQQLQQQQQQRQQQQQQLQQQPQLQLPQQQQQQPQQQQLIRMNTQQLELKKRKHISLCVESSYLPSSHTRSSTYSVLSSSSAPSSSSPTQGMSSGSSSPPRSSATLLDTAHLRFGGVSNSVCSATTAHYTRSSVSGNPRRSTCCAPDSSSSSSSASKVVASACRRKETGRLTLHDVAESLKKGQEEGALRVPKFMQRFPGGGEIQRDVGIFLIQGSDIGAMRSCAVQTINGFGERSEEQYPERYWKDKAKKGVSFYVALDGETVGYIRCENINNIDEKGVPLHYGVPSHQRTSRKLYKNLVCLSHLYFTAPALKDRNMNGVMQFAMGTVLAWLYEVEPRLEGAMAVVRTPGNDALSKIEGVTQMWDRARHLILSLPYTVKPLRKFEGNRMGSMNVLLILKPE